MSDPTKDDDYMAGELSLDLTCPDCGHRGLIVRPWWDDSYENGGQCIGDTRECPADGCHYNEDF